LIIKDSDLFEHLPLWMRDDPSAAGIVYALNNQMRALAGGVYMANLYARIDELSEDLLDELAWQFNLIEYNSILPIDSKREMIKNCFLTHRKRGTKSAVEKVVKTVFGNGWVEEWFDYSGTAGMFKVHTGNVGTSDEMVAEFDRLIKVTQNIRSHLELVIVEAVAQLNLSFAGVVRTSEIIYI